MRIKIRFLIFLLIMTSGLGTVLGQSPPLPLNYGQTVTGELNDVQQALQYIFDANAGDTITALMENTSGDLNTFLSLSTYEGEVIASDDDSGGETNALLQAEIPADGTYVLTATRSREAAVRGSGTFSLTLSAEGLEIATPEPVEVGQRLQAIARGTPIQEALTPEEAFSFFWFEGQSGETITLTLDPTTNLQPLLVLYDSSFTELLRSRPNTPLIATLPNEGLYFIAAALPTVQSVGGAYTLTLTTGTTPLTTSPPREVQPGQNPIAYGDNVSGAISNTASSYTFQFRGTQGDDITIAMSRAGGDLDSFLYLLDSGGVTLAQDDNGGGNGDARLSLTLPKDGDYLILATRKDQSTGVTAGNFLLSLISEATPIAITPPPSADKPASLANIPDIAIGQTISGTISNQAFLNVYTFRAEADDEIVIRMEQTSEVDPYLLLLDANQAPLAENDDVEEGENQNAEISYTIPSTGYYLIVATRFEQETGTTQGSYNLTLRLKSAGADAVSADTDDQSSLIRRLEAEPIIPATTPTDAFAGLKFANIYTFGITDPDSLIDISISTDNNLATTLIMADENLQPIAVSDKGSLLGVPIPASGNYVVIVAPAAGPATTVSENYILAFNATGEVVVVDATPESDEQELEPAALSITYGETVTGEITADINEIQYVFSGLEGDVVRIRMNANGSGLDPLLRLEDSTGKVLEEHDDIVAGENRDALLQVALPAAGDYTIVATHFIPEDGTPATIGTYDLLLEYVDPATAGISAVILPIASGETINNSVTDEQYLLFYSFEAESGDVATIEVRTLSGDLDGVLYLYTYSTGGAPVEIRRNDDSPRGGTFDPLLENVTLPRTGTYLIAVGRFPDSTSTGEFAMTLVLNPPSTDSSVPNIDALLTPTP